MAKYTVEYTYLVPHYVHEEIEADSHDAAVAEAKRRAEECEINWAYERVDFDSARPVQLTAMWEGEAYEGEEIKVLP